MADVRSSRLPAEHVSDRRSTDRAAAKAIASRVRAARLAAGTSEAVFAAELLLDPKKLKIYEAGRYRFSAQHIAVAARLFGREIAWFFGSAEAPHA